MEKICFIIQRYGDKILGGSESYCRQVAERLAHYYDVDVVTSQCTDFMTWENDIKETIEHLGGVTVRRFPSDCRRYLSEEHYDVAFAEGASTEDSMAWIEAQGPVCSSLLEYVKEHRNDYAAFVLVTYLFHPVVASSYLVGDKAVFIPTAHDELYIHQPVFSDVFSNVKALYFLTPEERAFVVNEFEVSDKISNDGAHAGVGVVLPDKVDPQEFRDKFDLGDKPYLLYAGRIERGKGCVRLFRYFEYYKKRAGCDDLQLVLMGKAIIDIPERDDVRYLGFVDEQDKFDGMAGALALVQPSENESLSIVTLEAMSLGTPALVNGGCHVLKGHCLRSNGGLYYDNAFTFAKEIDLLLGDAELLRQLGANAKAYVEKNYQWDVIIDGMRSVIDQVIEQA